MIFMAFQQFVKTTINWFKVYGTKITGFSEYAFANHYFSGTTYDGSWDGWYGPSGRDNTTLQAKIDHTTYLNEVFKIIYH